MPFSLPVNFLRNGTIILSYIGTNIMAPIAATEAIEVAGIVKLWLNFKFMVAACFTKSVDPCATHIPVTVINEVSHMGNMFKTSFVSSTLVIVDNLHELTF
ncbi:hypothetical protein RIF29_10266 [Crotalaria pallida]|uniref:Uncharacterized protein n=1 Tax=Crotalaria pallida TaxID=3830 RepID=A0AAN9FVK6_CROPI